MISSAAGVLIFLGVFGIAAAVDCRKMVFAPVCRGVAAKRGPINSGHFGPPEGQLSRNMNTNNEQFRSVRDPLQLDAEDSQTMTAADMENTVRKLIRAYLEMTATDMENTVRKLMRAYLEAGSKRYLRSLYKNMQDNSERDNFPAQEFKNL